MHSLVCARCGLCCGAKAQSMQHAEHQRLAAQHNFQDVLVDISPSYTLLLGNYDHWFRTWNRWKYFSKCIQIFKNLERIFDVAKNAIYELNGAKTVLCCIVSCWPAQLRVVGCSASNSLQLCRVGIGNTGIAISFAFLTSTGLSLTDSSNLCQIGPTTDWNGPLVGAGGGLRGPRARRSRGRGGPGASARLKTHPEPLPGRRHGPGGQVHAPQRGPGGRSQRPTQRPLVPPWNVPGEGSSSKTKGLRLTRGCKVAALFSHMPTLCHNLFTMLPPTLTKLWACSFRVINFDTWPEFWHLMIRLKL